MIFSDNQLTGAKRGLRQIKL